MAGRPALGAGAHIRSDGLHPRQYLALQKIARSRGSASIYSILREAVDFYLAYRDCLMSPTAQLEDLVKLGADVFAPDFSRIAAPETVSVLALGRCLHIDCADAAAVAKSPLASDVPFVIPFGREFE